MDANGLKFWMLAEERDWKFEPDQIQYDRARRHLRLAPVRSRPNWPAAPDQATQLIERVPQSLDRFGTRAFWSATDGKVMATGAAPGNIPLFIPAAGDRVTDVVLGYDDLLYLAFANRVTIVDPRGRFQPCDIATSPDFRPWRLTADPGGGAWILDHAHQRLARLIGQPSTIRPHGPYNAEVFRPQPENPNASRIVVLDAIKFDVDEQIVALATNTENRLALLCWKTDGSTHVRLVDDASNLTAPLPLTGAPTPFSLAWLSSMQIAMLAPGVNEALVYTLVDADRELVRDGAVYPLPGHDGGPLLHTVTLPPSYPTAQGCRGVYPLSLPAYARAGTTENALVMDSGNDATVWHRLYLEAAIPEHCGVTVRLATLDDPSEEPSHWYPHLFGAALLPDGQTPHGSWITATSEIPFHPGVLNCARVKDRAGLFTVLIQRTGTRARSLRGRYLKVRLELQGSGLATPEVAALRAYGSRFSYVDHYLPELYRENLFGADADSAGGCTPADFLERFLDNFEGVLTPLEDRIAGSYLLTDPAVAPAESLEWLGSWIGLAFDHAYDEAQRRRLLAAAPELYRRRGTLRGLGLALDIATNGAGARGQLVILEDYRLRRTFATILGAHLDDADDSLLAGISNSGNSYIGETLFLGDRHRGEFLALYGAALPATPQEQAAVEAFFDELAYRVTILVHQEIDPQDLGLIRRVAALETPAHVAVTVQTASQAFRAGVAALVGVDSYLAPKPPIRRARIDESWFGRGDLVMRIPSLDPRLDGDDSPPPEAVLSAPPAILVGNAFTLHAGLSKAPTGRAIAKYIWTRLD